MNHRSSLLPLFLSCAILFPNLAPAQNVVSAPAPDGEPLSTQFQVTAEKTNVPVYLARVCSLQPEERVPLQRQVIEQTTTTSFGSFDMSVPVQVTVTCSDDVTSVKALPTSYGITPQVNGKTITFQVTQPGQITIEVNGNWINSLHLFANPMETDIPDPHDPNVIYFGPGIHNVESVVVGSNKTVYLAGGAIIYGHSVKGSPWGAVLQLKGNNITLRGRGIIDGSLCPEHWPTFSADGTQNTRVEGITIRDSCQFSLPFRQAHHVTIDNVKVFGWRGNSDGMDVCNSSQVEISNCFLRTFDDLIVMKTDLGKGELRDISVKHCVLWNEFAHALSLGNELREPLTNISFSDCDVIHDKGRETVMRVYNIDAGPVTNVSFDNIRVEEARKLMGVWLGKNAWSMQKEAGHVTNVVFSNITSTVPVLPGPYAKLTGYDATHTSDNILFQNVVVGNQPLTLDKVEKNEFVRNVILTP